MPLTSEERYSAILQAITDTDTQLKHGEEIYKDLKRTVCRMRLAVLWLAIIGVVAAVALSVGVRWGFDNQAHISAVNAKRVQCNVDASLVATDTPQQYAGAPNKPAYVDHFHVIYQDMQQLGCSPLVSEPVRK